MWMQNISCLDQTLVKDTRPWSNFDNTCGHNKSLCKNAFKNSKAYFCAEGLTVNGYKAREWNKLYPMIEIIRLPEVLDYYRKKD